MTNYILILIYAFQMIGIQTQTNLLSLKFMAGSWEHKTEQVITGGNAVKEAGTANIDFILDSTFLRLQVELYRNDSKRSYLQLIGFKKSDREFESTYFYSGTTRTVRERGFWDPEEEKLELRGINPWSSSREDGINIKSTFQFITDNEFRLEVLELRTDGRWIKGYSSVFKRKK